MDPGTPQPSGAQTTGRHDLEVGGGGFCGASGRCEGLVPSTQPVGSMQGAAGDVVLSKEGDIKTGGVRDGRK